MCKVLEVSKSGFYNWLSNKPSKRSIQNTAIISQIRTIHKESRDTYGSPRITIALQQRGISVSRPRVARLMKSAKIRSVISKKYVITTDSKHDYVPAPNLLNRSFRVNKPGKAWVSDLTYIKAGGQWLYFTAVIDLFDRKVVGWSTSDNMSAKDTTVKALKMALFNRRTEELILHSDRGIQYACEEFRSILKKENITQSMSRKANCWDNAVAESFFKTLKVECTNRFKFPSILEAKTEIFRYVEGWYNRKRIHSANGYISPNEKSLNQLKLVA